MIWLLLACQTEVEPGPQLALPETDVLADSVHTGDVDLFEGPEACAECHPTHYAQWRTSMHAYAAQSPIFDAMAAKAYRDTSGEVGTFCTRCHSPIGALQGEPGWVTAEERSELSLHGVSCDVCHTAVAHDGPVGNANLVLAPGGAKQGPFDDAAGSAHMVEASDLTRSSELCGTCHDVFMEPGLDIEEAFSEYTGSPADDTGKRCQDCHMSPTPGRVSPREVGPIAVVPGETYPDRELSDHSFVGPDYSVLESFPFPGEEGVEARAAYDLQVQVLLENAVQLNSVVVDDQGVDNTFIHVGVTSLIDSHRVPTGFTSERQLWVELEVVDDTGEVVFTSGDLDELGDLRDTHSSQVQSGEVSIDLQLTNFQSKNMAISREWTESGSPSTTSDPDQPVEVIFPFDANWIEKYSLEPLETKNFRYHVKFPEDHDGSISEVRVRLLYRNLPPYVLRALQLDDIAPQLKIFEVSSAAWSPTE